MTQQIDQQPNMAPNTPFEIRVKTERGLALRWKVLGGAAVVGAVVVAAGQVAHIPGIPQFGDFMTSTVAPEHTAITAKTITIKPVSFDCRSMGVYDAGSSVNSNGDTVAGSTAAVKTHGFVHAAEAEKAKVVATVCATNVQETIGNDGIDVASNTVRKTVDININSLVFNAQFSEPDTLIVDRSDKGTELLSGAAGAADAIIDGTCTIITLGNCDNGVPNPADAAVKMSNEDQAKTEQYLRITILKAVQEQCLAGDWQQFKQAIIDAYTQQATLQSANPTDVTVRFVDDNGNETTLPPDFTKKAIQSLIDAGAITANMPDVEVSNAPNITCTPLPVSAADLTGVSTTGVGGH